MIQDFEQIVVFSREYEFNGIDFVIDINISFKNKLIEAWVSAKNYGVKSFMFGLSTKDVTIEKAMEIANNNVYDYVSDYVKEYMDYDDKERFGFV